MKVPYIPSMGQCPFLSQYQCQGSLCEPFRPHLEKMEWMLYFWIERQVHKRKSNIDNVAIREKTVNFYQYIASKEGQ